MSPKKQNETAEQIKEMLRMQTEMQKYNSFFRWKISQLRQGTLYGHTSRILTYLRRFRLVGFLVRIASWIALGLETGALLLLSTALLLILLPPLLFLALALLLTVLIEAPQKKRELMARTAKKRIYVLFLQEEPTPFEIWNIQDLASQPESLVLLVSPFCISPRGMQKGAFYCTVRKERESIYLVRRYAFFYLKRNVLQQRNCVYLY